MSLPMRRCGQPHSAISCRACELFDENAALRARVAECEADHPPEPQYVAWCEEGMPDVAALRAQVKELSERLGLCDVPDGWEAWRIKAEAKVEELTRERCHHGWKGSAAEAISTPCPSCGLWRERAEQAESEVARLAKVAAAVAQWQGADSLSDCPACAVLDAALAAARGEEGK